MIRERISTTLLSVSIVVGIAGAAMLAQAGSAGNGTAGNGLPQFKTLSLYRYEADAQKGCHGDQVVWAAARISASTTSRVLVHTTTGLLAQ
jgi:hypothetical protein